MWVQRPLTLFQPVIVRFSLTIVAVGSIWKTLNTRRKRSFLATESSPIRKRFAFVSFFTLVTNRQNCFRWKQWSRVVIVDRNWATNWRWNWRTPIRFCRSGTVHEDRCRAVCDFWKILFFVFSVLFKCTSHKTLLWLRWVLKFCSFFLDFCFNNYCKRLCVNSRTLA